VGPRHDFDREWREHPTPGSPALWVTRAWAPALQPGRVLLDLGCGTGRHSLAWAKAGGIAHAIDASAAALAAVAAACGALPVHTRRLDLDQSHHRLPRADVVIAARILYLLEAPLQLVDRALHAVRPGGMLLLGDQTTLLDEVQQHLGGRASWQRASASHLLVRPLVDALPDATPSHRAYCATESS